jgi:hypothetical protein
MKMGNKVQIFDKHHVRSIWDEEQGKWWFSVVDIVAVLTDSDYQTARKYWKVLKGRLADEGSNLFASQQGNKVVSDSNQLKKENELVTDCYHLKKENELYQLPPINVIVAEKRTRVTIYCYQPLNNLNKEERIRACYQHACLKYVSNEKMTNQTLRNRFKIEDSNYPIASRIIRDTLSEKLIKEEDPESKSRKYASYLPYWA